jgi:hypothetical protein
MKLLYVDEPRDSVAAIDFFLQEAANVDEYDYGDCMREWNRELLYLKTHLKDAAPWAKNKMFHMQEYIQFTPNWDVSATRERILKDARELREHLVLAENAGRAA